MVTTATKTVAPQHDYRPDDPSPPAELSPAAAAWVRRAVDSAPPLRAEQRTRLAELLSPVRTVVGGEPA